MADPSDGWYGPRLPGSGPRFDRPNADDIGIRAVSTAAALDLTLTAAYQQVGAIQSLANPSEAKRYAAHGHFSAVGGNGTTGTVNVYAALEVRYDGAGSWTQVAEQRTRLPETAADPVNPGVYAYADMPLTLGSAIPGAPMPEPCTLIEVRLMAKVDPDGAGIVAELAVEEGDGNYLGLNEMPAA